MNKISYRRHRFPAEIIQRAVWLCFRFPLSYRDVEDLLAERGVDVSYETIRRWSLKFGQAYARKLRQSRPRPDDRWHLDEVFSSINGKRMYLWRAVDSEGEVLDILVQSRRNKKAALKLMRKLLKKQGYAPNKVVTDKLPSYGAALRDLNMTGKHVRLAFARMLAKTGAPAPVILDDAIVYTDDDRIERMFDALTRQARDLQIIVFSCRQKAFRDLGGRSLNIGPAD